MSSNVLDRPSATELPGLSLDSLDLTDLGNAHRFVTEHGSRVRYVDAWKSFLTYDGIRWRRDDLGEVERMAKHTMLQMYDSLKDLPDSKERRDLFTRLQRSLSAQRLHAMIDLVKSEPGIPVCPEHFDANPWLLNVQNGTIDLLTGDLGPHDPADLITKLAPVNYREDAKAPVWDAFLDRIMGGDSDLMGYLRRIAGYSMTGDTSERAIFILYGSGANGKSKFLEAISYVLGDYARHTRADVLLTKRNNDSTHEVAVLRGARLVTASESEDGRRLAEGLVKSVTGDEKIRSRLLYQNSEEFKPEFKILVATNHKPIVKGQDEGIWDRLKLVPFLARITENERDLKLGDKLQAEAEGILWWMIQGLKEWRQWGLATPETVRAATAGYRDEMDTLGLFLGERTQAAPGSKAQLKEVYRAYTDWVSGNGLPRMSSVALAAELRRRGLDVRPSTANQTYVFNLEVTAPITLV